MTRTSTFRIAALAVVLLMTLAACGQRKDVHAKGTGGGFVLPGQDVPGAGNVPGASGVPGAPGSVPGASGALGAAPPGSVPAPGQPGAPGAPVASGAGDRTGITPTTITIGLHAPLTGAAPIEPIAFKKGKDLYWRWLQEIKGNTVFGRKVKVVFRDDTYTPTTAVAVCDQMATNERSFLLIGGAGADQINACAEYAEPRGIPYLSPGVQKVGLDRRKTYFAVTMTYADQMPLLVNLLKKENAKKSMDKYGGVGGGNGKIKVGFVRPNTPNFGDADQALKAAVAAAGWEYKSYSVVKEGSSSEARTTAQLASSDGVDILVPITAPTFTVQLALNADGQSYKPQWAGVAISNNINQFLDTVCGRTENTNSTVQGALWFSPWAGWKQVMNGEYDADFKVAADRFASDVNTRSKGGDILLALWGIMKTIHQAFLAAGKDMSRGSFVTTMQNFRLSTKMFPDLQFSPGNPFGAKNVHVLKANCAEPAQGDVARGAQYVEHPDYPGLRNTF